MPSGGPKRTRKQHVHSTRCTTRRGVLRVMRRGFGWVRKLPSDWYQASFPHPLTPGERIKAPSTFSHKGDAEHWLRMQERAIERGEWLSPEEVEARRPKVRTLQETYGRFLAQRPRPLALSTLTAYEQDWRLRIVPHWGPSAT